MSERIPIMKTKFIPPFFKDTYVRRPQLVKKLNTIVEYPLTFIHAGAGYGKSSTLSLFVRDLKVKFIWYSIAKQDDDFYPFFIHFIYAIRSHFPTFGENILRFVYTQDQMWEDIELDFLCSEVINELSIMGDDFVIILDDFHYIRHSDTVKTWFEAFIEFMPANIHLVISSRLKPDWDIFTRLLVKGDMLEIDKYQLTFSKEEIDVLFEDYYGVKLNLNQIDQIFELTEGWIIAVQLFRLQIRDDSFQPVTDMHSKSLDDLFRYLSMEVFQKQDVRVQAFLLQTSALEILSASICKEILGMEDADDQISQLVNENLFLTDLGQGEYRYHLLFKEFLQSQLKKEDQRYSQLHHQIAQFYMKNSDYERAIEHFLKFDDFEQIAIILEAYGSQMLSNGKIELLHSTLKQIPKIFLDKYYSLRFIEAEIYRYRCQYQKANELYRKLEKLGKDHEDSVFISLGLEGQARVYLDTIQPKMADRFLRDVIKLIDDSKLVLPNEKMKALYELIAENLVNLGNLKDAQKWIDKCKEVDPNYSNTELESRFHLRAGRLELAKSILLDKGYDSIPALTKSHREMNLILALIHSFIGEAELARSYADSGISHGKNRNAPFTEACGWIRIGHALQLHDLKEKLVIINAYETALRIMGELDVSRGKAEPLMGLCLLYGRLGSYRQAVQYGEKALNETNKVDDLWLSSFIRLSLGIAAYFGNRKNVAFELFKECQTYFDLCGGQYGLMVSSYWLSRLSYEEQKWDCFCIYMKSFLRLIRINEYLFFISNKTLFGPTDVQALFPLLLEAKKRNIEQKFLEQLLRNLGFEDLSFHPGYSLKIQTFGEFQVWLGDQIVLERGWKREKAKEIFQLLLTKKSGSLSKEDIISELWKESDNESAQRDFKVALNALNKVLEPERKARTKSFFIERVGSLYSLNPKSVIMVDKNDFERLMEEGLDESDHEIALQKLKKGLALYKGDYLVERRYDDWCIEVRDRLKVLFLRGAERTAQIHLAYEEFDLTIRYCDEILSIDPTWEEAYRLLIYCYYRKNNRPYSIKLYETCKEILERELGVKPLETTKRMYEMVLETLEVLK